MKKLLISFIAIVISISFTHSAFALEKNKASKKDDRSVEVKGKQSAAPVSTGGYYAVIIGNNEYRHLPKLKTAKNDARDVENILKHKYGFKTELLLDATRADIIKAINRFSKKLSTNDNFLLYYAGHGEYEKSAEKAYWLPVDAERDNDANWIISDDITANIKRFASKHVLVVSDSCYSGKLTRSVTTNVGNVGDAYLSKMFQRPSRTVMASGGNEPVSDSGGGKNSVFAAAFIKALSEPDETVFTAEQIFHKRVKTIVAGKSEQVPEYSDIRNSGHEGGDFIFQLTSAGQVYIPPPVVSQPQPVIAFGGSFPKETVEEKPRTYTDSVTGMEFVFVKGGCFDMGDTFGDGDSDEKPVHQVCIDDFYIGKYEVTQGQWETIMGNNPSYFKNCGSDCPVEQVSWNDIQNYIQKLNQKSGKGGRGGFRLPTEAEWEYAARSGGKREKWAGTSSESELGDYAWYDKNSGGKTHQVGQKKPNGLGLYDMSGNVWEWVGDWYDKSYYSNSPKNNPTCPYSGSVLVARGGSRLNSPMNVRTSVRFRL